MASDEMVHTMGQEIYNAQETIKAKDKEIERLRCALKTISNIYELPGPADDLVALCRDVATEALEGEE